MKILIAPNAFKNSLKAQQTAEAIRDGLVNSLLKPQCILQPIADGGDGMLDVLLSQTKGVKIHATVEDPLGRLIEAEYGLIHDGKTGVIEMAEASGLRLLSSDELNPMQASTFGTGQLIKHALDHGVEQIMLGVGGSATVDGGLGMAMALGVKLVDASGNLVKRGAEGLQQLHSIDLSSMDERLHKVKIIVPCDVTTTLVESAEVYGPQKGATPEMVRQISQWLQAYGRLVKSIFGKDIVQLESGGAAGGISATLHALFNAELVNGTEYLLSQTGFDKDLSQADLVMTAEGALDAQTQAGKGPFYVANQAKKLGKPVIMLAGSLPQPFEQEKYRVYDAVFPIGARPESLQEAIGHTRSNLTRTAQQIGNLLACC